MSLLIYVQKLLVISNDNLAKQVSFISHDLSFGTICRQNLHIHCILQHLAKRYLTGKRVIRSLSLVMKLKSHQHVILQSYK